MKLEYEATLADLAQPQIRLFLRSGTLKKQRLFCALGVPVVFFGCMFLFDNFPNSGTEWGTAIIIVAAASALLSFSRKYIVTSRIRRYIARERGEEIPSQTVYTVDQQRICCSSLGVDIAFSLENIESVAEVGDYLEVYFGTRGICTIPLRAFDSDSQKQEFLFALRTRQGT